MATTRDKPAGIPVFPPHADPDGPCVLARLWADEPHRREVAWPDGFAGGIAHRLDISTSGALAVADDPDELAWLRERFAQRDLIKRYRFLAAKDVPWDDNTCTRPIGHDKRRKGRVVVQRGANTPHRGKWRDAHTTFRRVEGRLWEAVIITGVMHQIRAHAAFVGLSLLGDRRYGGGPTPADAPTGVTFFLHHVGMHTRDGGFSTTPVPFPSWAQT
jgi:23S rRNA pseudouridine1911/1915/1917 synthase